MGNKDSPELTLSLLLMAALCLEASIIRKSTYFSYKKMDWTEARLYCQENTKDMAILKTARSQLTELLREENINQVWIGLHRDPEDESVWKWINVKTGEGISGDDLSQSSNWANGSQNRHCVFVSDEDQMWYSTSCSRENGFYCSVQDKVQHHKIALSWYNASLYCQNNSSELATITEINRDGIKKYGWIGLYRDPGEDWRWIGDVPSDYRNWAPGEPSNADCASFDTLTEKWQSNVCSEKLNPLCSIDNLVVVNMNKTWEDALSYCQQMETPCASSSGSCSNRYNLVSLEYLSDFSYVKERIYRLATTDEVWTGLRFLAGKWLWVDGERLVDHGMLPDCPSLDKHCGTLSKYDTSNWIIRDCSERRNFICYKQKVLLSENEKKDKEK
ncbi:macrophage mannose receptor 1-like [Dicentrarchus labrax]|uniref:C-type lectin domain-containing protein n=1 Tax=Dicentrarchus labrax TaxID=13489 RepID=A0A8C4DCN3_DICLA|nr:macrophage mannose receptor 1-like [Dicentrarchus labrax]